MVLSGTLLGVLLAAGGKASCSAAPPIADIPPATYRPAGPSVSPPPLLRTHDLVRAFATGEGVLHSSPAAGMPWRTALDVSLLPLPWAIAQGRHEGARLVGWRGRTRHVDSEGMIAFVLRDGEWWCSPPLDVRDRSRLRYEALAAEEGAPPRLRVRARSGQGSRLLRLEPVPAAATFHAGAQVDLPLLGGSASLCFEAVGGTVAVGEARVLAPEAPGQDPRPRWIVMLMIDALRGDALEGAQAFRDNPALVALAARGHVYRSAVSGGCHTQAGVWPTLMGRDLMRVDPLRRRSFVWSSQPYLPLEAVYARPNLFLTHLAQEAGYHPVFLGNNSFLDAVPAFARYSIQGRRDTGTVETVSHLPALFARYADERVMLLYYVSTPHNSSFTPRRLYEQFGCAALPGLDECRCRYSARVRHADESVASFQAALAHNGLAARTLQVVTADHGEAFGDRITLESDISGQWNRIDLYHGFTCQWSEVHVPLVVAGPGLQPATWTGPVSTLDVAATLARAVGLNPPNRLDGEVLPLSAGGRAPGAPRRLVSYGYCNHSVVEGQRQLLWWLGDCGNRRPVGGGPTLPYVSELWSGSAQLATDRTDPALLRRAMAAHESWLGDRLPAEAMVLDATGLPPSRLTITAASGRIVDYGPSSTVYGLSRIRSARLDPDGRTLRVDLDRFEGLYSVATSPPLSPVRIDVSVSGRRPLVLLGPHQLPLDLLGRVLDPARHPRYFFAEATPPARATPEPRLRVWWQPSRRPGAAREGEGRLLDFGRVLREWGYIR